MPDTVIRPGGVPSTGGVVVDNKTICGACQDYQTWLAETEDVFGHRRIARESEQIFDDLMARLQIRADPARCHCSRSGRVTPRQRGYVIGPGFHPKGRQGDD